MWLVLEVTSTWELLVYIGLVGFFELALDLAWLLYLTLYLILSLTLFVCNVLSHNLRIRMKKKNKKRVWTNPMLVGEITSEQQSSSYITCTTGDGDQFLLTWIIYKVSNNSTNLY